MGLTSVAVCGVVPLADIYIVPVLLPAAYHTGTIETTTTRSFAVDADYPTLLVT